MDLSTLDIGPGPVRTRLPPAQLSFDRELTLEDLAERRARWGELNASWPAVKRLTHRHHALARTLASGVKPADAAAICGYELHTVHILKMNPAFMELVNFFARNVNERYIEMQAGMAALGADVVETLHERLDTEPETFSNHELIDLMAKTADRTGAGPSTTNVQVNIHAGLAERLEAARKKAREASLIIEGSAEERE